MKLKVLNYYNRVALFFLSVFGLLPSCDDGPIFPSGGAEYGTPWARYKVSGKVLDSKTKEGINNIGILAFTKHNIDDSVHFSVISDTIKTNKEGEYMSDLNVAPTSDSVHLKFFDVNNPATYQAKDTAVWFDADNLQGGDGWFAGEASQRDNIYLDEY